MILTIEKTKVPQQAHNDSAFVPEQPCYALPALRVAIALDVDQAEGLNPEEVEKRRAKYGAKVLQTIRPIPAWRIFLNQFASITWQSIVGKDCCGVTTYLQAVCGLQS